MTADRERSIIESMYELERGRIRRGQWATGRSSAFRRTGHGALGGGAEVTRSLIAIAVFAFDCRCGREFTDPGDRSRHLTSEALRHTLGGVHELETAVVDVLDHLVADGFDGTWDDLVTVAVGIVT